MADKPITVFIADDHETMREELCAMLSGEPGFDVVGQCGDGRKAVEQVKLLRPDVAVLDISLPGRNGLDICRELTRSVNSTAILILAIQDRRRPVVRAFVYGALGYLLKTSAVGHFLEAIRTVARGELYLAPGILKTVRGHPLSGEDEFYKRFSLRAKLVRQFIAEGKTTREIAGILGQGPGPKSPVHAVRHPGNQGHLGGFANSGDSVPRESGKYPEVDEGLSRPEEDETNPPSEQVREELASALFREPGHTVVRRYGDWPEAIEEINRLITDDVVVVDIDTPGQNGLDICCELSQKIKGKAVLILAVRSDANSVIRAFEYGASGYLLKKNAVVHLPEAIQTVARGELYLGPDIPREVLYHIHPGEDSVSDRLAEMMQVVERLLARKEASREITVFLADSLELYRQGVASLLDKIDGLKVVGQCGDGVTALEQVNKLRPDIVVTDGMMPNMNGWDLCHELTRTTNDMAVLFLAIVDDEKFIAKAFECGASGCLQKRNAVEHLPEAIQTVARGELYLGPDIPRTILGYLLSREEDHYKLLTPREKQVLQLLAEGETINKIAEELGVTPKTVKTYRRRLMRKLDIHDQASLIRYAVRKGLVDS